MGQSPYSGLFSFTCGNTLSIRVIEGTADPSLVQLRSASEYVPVDGASVAVWEVHPGVVCDWEISSGATHASIVGAPATHPDCLHGGVSVQGISPGSITVTAETCQVCEYPPYDADSIDLTVVELDWIKVTDANNGALTVTNPSAEHLCIGELDDGTAEFEIDAGITSDTSGAREFMRWRVDGDEICSAAAGDFSGTASVVVRATDTNRDFTVKAGGDSNGNFMLDDEEVIRTIQVHVVKVDIDTDRNHNGNFDDDMDSPEEESAPGLNVAVEDPPAATGGIRLQAMLGATPDGEVVLKVDVPASGARLKLKDAQGEVVLDATAGDAEVRWTVGVDAIPTELYIQAETESNSLGDTTFTLSYQSPVADNEDVVLDQAIITASWLYAVYAQDSTNANNTAFSTRSSPQRIYVKSGDANSHVMLVPGPGPWSNGQQGITRPVWQPWGGTEEHCSEDPTRNWILYVRTDSVGLLGVEFGYPDLQPDPITAEIAVVSLDMDGDFDHDGTVDADDNNPDNPAEDTTPGLVCTCTDSDGVKINLQDGPWNLDAGEVVLEASTTGTGHIAVDVEGGESGIIDTQSGKMSRTWEIGTDVDLLSFVPQSFIVRGTAASDSDGDVTLKCYFRDPRNKLVDGSGDPALKDEMKITVWELKELKLTESEHTPNYVTNPSSVPDPDHRDYTLYVGQDAHWEAKLKADMSCLPATIPGDTFRWRITPYGTGVLDNWMSPQQQNGVLDGDFLNRPLTLIWDELPPAAPTREFVFYAWADLNGNETRDFGEQQRTLWVAIFRTDRFILAETGNPANACEDRTADDTTIDDANPGSQTLYRDTLYVGQGADGKADIDVALDWPTDVPGYRFGWRIEAVSGDTGNWTGGVYGCFPAKNQGVTVTWHENIDRDADTDGTPDVVEVTREFKVYAWTDIDRNPQRDVASEEGRLLYLSIVKMDIDGDLNRDGTYDEDDPAEHTAPGLIVAVNDDSDDHFEDDIPDRDDGYDRDPADPDDDTVAGENDLVAIQLQGAPGTVSHGAIVLSLGEGDESKVRVWAPAGKSSNRDDLWLGTLTGSGDPGDPDIVRTTKVWLIGPEPFDDADGDGLHDPGETYVDLNGNGTWDASGDFSAMSDFATQLPWLEGIASGSAELILTYRDPGGNDIHSDTLIVSITKVELDEISFRGVHPKSIPLKHHDSGNISPPEWKDADGDGNPDDERKNVGAWVKNSTTNTTPIQVKAKFKVQPPSLTSLKVYAQNASGPGSLYKPSTTDPLEITAAAGWEGTFQLDASLTGIRYFGKSDWNWQWKVTEVEGTPLNCDVGETTHDICMTAASPVATPVFKWVVMPSCRAAHGQASDDKKTITDDVFDGTGSGLGTVARVDNWTTALRFGANYAPQTVGTLLDNQEGRCGIWQPYFRDLTGAHGVDLVLRTMTPQNNAAAPETKWYTLTCTSFGINATTGYSELPGPVVVARRFVTDDTAYPLPTVADLTIHDNPPANPPGKEGWYRFGNHAVTFLDQNGTANDWLYDPSFELKAQFAVPAAGSSVEYLITSPFRINYLDSAFEYMGGMIYLDIGGGSPGLPGELIHVKTSLIDGTEKIKLRWD